MNSPVVRLAGAAYSRDVRYVNASPSPRTALLLTSLSREGGGVFTAVSALSNSMTAMGFEHGVFGVRDRHTQDDLGSWRCVRVTAAPSVGPTRLALAPALGRRLVAYSPDLIHVHGLWQYHSYVALRWSRRSHRPFIISPHGMLDRWALQHASLKKRLAGLLFHNRVLHCAAGFHALTDAEARSIRELGFKQPIYVIPNGVAVPNIDSRVDASCLEGRVPRDKRLVLFLGRLHPKKGITELLQAWAARSRATAEFTRDWHLVVAGWDESGHESELKRLAAALGVHESVCFFGPAFGTAKDALFRLSDAFILPSRSEGLPVAILEAWAYELPVIMTRECNLEEGFARGAAIQIDCSPESISRGLEYVTRASVETLQKMGEAGRALIEAEYALEATARQMVKAYKHASGFELATPNFTLL